MQNKKEVFQQLIAPLYLLLQLSGKSYQQYLDNKIYLNAAILRRTNQRICKLLYQSLALVPEELHEDVVALLNHYNGWLIQFNNHKRDKKPGLADPFIFGQIDRALAYPLQAEEDIIRYYKRVKQELDNESLVKQGMRNA